MMKERNPKTLFTNRRPRLLFLLQVRVLSPEMIKTR